MEVTFDRLLSHSSPVEGITITGGEPLEQPLALLRLLKLVRAHSTLSVILFSGFTREEIAKIPCGNAIVDCVDVLITGRFLDGYRLGKGLRGSSNKTIQCVTNRYNLAQLETTPDAEVLIEPDGNILVSGVDDVASYLTCEVVEPSCSGKTVEGLLAIRKGVGILGLPSRT